jgi:hypothetical protein
MLYPDASERSGSLRAWPWRRSASGPSWQGRARSALTARHHTTCRGLADHRRVLERTSGQASRVRGNCSPRRPGLRTPARRRRNADRHAHGTGSPLPNCFPHRGPPHGASALLPVPGLRTQSSAQYQCAPGIMPFAMRRLPTLARLPSPTGRQGSSALPRLSSAWRRLPEGCPVVSARRSAGFYPEGWQRALISQAGSAL